MTLDEAYEIKVGDYVMVKDDEYTINDEPLKESKLLVVEDDTVKFETPSYRINSTKVERCLIKDFPEDFTKVEDSYFASGLLGEQAEELGVYRPNLQDRKVGKIGMHFVDDGFPNALRAVAEVMTWAAVAKGYKLHDWKNLPNAEVAIPSAAYRHRNDNSVQKAQGLSALDRTDHESKLLHKAHEAFNTLAELELIITGVIK
jgi:hypothetical protein